MTAKSVVLNANQLACTADQARAEILNAHLKRVFDLREHVDHDRHDIESFIQQCFAAAHGATIRHFMPRLLSLCAKGGDRIAAFGLRDAAADPLFLERYLDQPIEDILKSRLGLSVNREEVIEVGNLSALYPGAARWLIVGVTAMLHDAGYRWVTFTGTTALRNGFHRLGLRPIELGSATLSHLMPHERADWGSYYDHSPKVYVGDIAHGYQSLLMQRDLSQLMRAGIDTVEGGQSA
jgi:hypothetical protein